MMHHGWVAFWVLAALVVGIVFGVVSSGDIYAERIRSGYVLSRDQVFRVVPMEPAK